MDELATVPLLADYDRGFAACAVHQQTQRTYAIGDNEGGNQALVLLDVNLQVVATVETAVVPEDADYGFRPIRDVAVHGDQVIVLTTNDHAEGSGLRLLDLDGRFLRTLAAGRFRNPQAVTASHGRALVVDEEEGAPGKVLYVIDIQSGDIIQRVGVDLLGGAAVSAVLVDGDEVYIASFGASKVVVLRYAGSEA